MGAQGKRPATGMQSKPLPMRASLQQQRLACVTYPMTVRVTGERQTVSTLSTGIHMENQFVTRNVFSESNVSPFRQHGRMFGFVRRQLGISRRLVAMPAGESNTVITSVGASCAMKTNSVGSPSLPRRCQKFGGELLRI